jgi:large subunit ribosomal protein L2
MALKKLRPVTPGTRHRLAPSFSDITKTTPEKSLVVTVKKTGGRNSKGRMTMRYIGGGHKQKLRIIDFKRNKFDAFRTHRFIVLR